MPRISRRYHGLLCVIVASHPKVSLCWIITDRVFNMDTVKAKLLEEALVGKVIEGWCIVEYINHGKSAAVFKATRGPYIAAVKIFDDDLIKRYGDATQFARIDRELSLIGNPHPYIVKIIGGGIDAHSKNHYIIMGYVEGSNVLQCLEQIPFDKVALYGEQLASAAQHLESLNLCHRDIKPENIAVSPDYERVTLLDLGVIKPIGVTGLTDGDDIRNFVGTLQYSSPEFLLRQEEDNIDGWRALTYYQIGAVLHDLIMKKPLFQEFASPYAALVNAVQHNQPIIQNPNVSQTLINLVSKCLLKDWRVRLSLIEWDDFKVHKNTGSTQSSAKQRVANRSSLLRAQGLQSQPEENSQNPSKIINRVMEQLKTTIRSIKNENGILPRSQVLRNPAKGNCLLVTYSSMPELGLPFPLIIMMKVDVLEAQSNAVRLLASTSMGSPTDPSDEVEIELFSGVFDAATVREALEEHVYWALDYIQTTENLFEGCWLRQRSG